MSWFPIIHLHLVDLYGKCQQILPYKDPTSMVGKTTSFGHFGFWYASTSFFSDSWRTFVPGFVTAHWVSQRIIGWRKFESKWFRVIIPCENCGFGCLKIPKNIQTKTTDESKWTSMIGWNKTYVTLPLKFNNSEFTPEKITLLGPFKRVSPLPTQTSIFQG